MPLPNSGGVVLGGYGQGQQGTPKPAPAPGQQPTFQPASSTLALPATDPRIAQLMASLQQQRTPLTPSSSVGTPNFDNINAQSGQLRTLLGELMAGRGPAVGSIDGDPEAKAFRTARLREAERSRESEAARLGASGLSGSGDFDSRVAQVNESAGTDIAGFEGALAGRRKGEAMAAATTGANLQLSELDRQRSDVQSQFDAQQRSAEIEAARADSQAQMDHQSKMDLLSVLLGQQNFNADLAFRQSAESRAKAAEGRTQAEFNQTDAGKIAQTAATPPPNAHWDPRYGWVQNTGQQRSMYL